MTIILAGLNHRTAPVELREKLALSGCALTMALEELRDPRPVVLPGNGNGISSGNGHKPEKKNGNGNGHLTVPVQYAAVEEGVIISTCNRLEVYAVATSQEAGWQHLEQFLAGLEDISLDELRPHLYLAADHDAVKHLMRVAAGLDSMILGEPQILGQVTSAYNDAQHAGLVGSVLSHLFSQAIHAGKRARSETDISRFTTSVSHAGARLVLEKLNGLQSPRVLVVGAGEMAVLAAKSLQKQGVKNLSFINRTYRRAESLALEIGGQSLSWSCLDEALTQADAVITATGAPHTVIYARDVESILPARGGRPLLLVDIAVPRDVEDDVGLLEGVQRYDIDDLQSIVDSGTARREAAVPDVEKIIEQEIHTFMEWHYGRQVKPVIQNLRRRANEIAQNEITSALNKLGDVDDRTANVVSRMANRIVNQLLHEPTVRLRGQAVEGNGDSYARAVSALFGLQIPHCAHWQSEHCADELEESKGDVACNLHCIRSDQEQELQ